MVTCPANSCPSTPGTSRAKRRRTSPDAHGAPARLSREVRSRHLMEATPGVRRVVEVLRTTILGAAPDAHEAIKFHVLCYFHADSFFGSIGGNICMIEVKPKGVLLSFIHGALLKDPAGLLFGKAKSKRFVRITSVDDARRPDLSALIRGAAKLRPWD